MKKLIQLQIELLLAVAGGDRWWWPAAVGLVIALIPFGLGRVEPLR